MLTWIKAFFMSLKPEQEVNRDDFVVFSDLFEQPFLNDVYAKFQSHLNTGMHNEFFVEVIKEKFFTGTEWENIQKRISNLEMNRTAHETAQFLESNCYYVWFAKKFLEGHSFALREKVALLSFTMFHEYRDSDKAYDFDYVEQEFVAMKEEVSEVIVNILFNTHLQQVVKDYELLTYKGATA